ncbi:MAG: glycosyltransferase family 39 protein [Planctomycetaceae bacterium]|nr:glycosyltransferase family 39 protein [Planctomycetaceae bacterium]
MGSLLAEDQIPDAVICRDAVDLESASLPVGCRVVAIFSSPRVRQLAVQTAVVTLLSVHAGLLAYAATRHSPTLNEPGHLVAGLAMWEFSRFEVYRVNPPLTRLVAALPVLAAGYEMDWSRFYAGPGARPEFLLGADFIKANGVRSLRLFTIARWACIPFSLVGGVFCFLWGRELYGAAAGLASLALWCLDPNVLAHAELITPDAAVTAFGIGASYAFWRWLKAPIWGRAAVAGLLLGLAQLSKMSWLLLFGLWPLLWLIWRATERPHPSRNTRRQIGQLAAILLLGLYVLNLGYLFDGTFTPLKDFAFVSKALAGEDRDGHGGNRFAGTWLGEVPAPLPRQYLLGFDAQKRDFEDFAQLSYLRGKWKDGGWWYYYLYGCLVKVPHGTQALLLLAAGLTLLRPGNTSWRDEIILLAPPVALFALVSSQTEFSHHFRYVLPSLGLLLIFLGKPFLGSYYPRSAEGAIPRRQVGTEVQEHDKVQRLLVHGLFRCQDGDEQGVYERRLRRTAVHRAG